MSPVSIVLKSVGFLNGFLDEMPEIKFVVNISSRYFHVFIKYINNTPL